MNKALIDTDILSYFLNGEEQVIIRAEDYLSFHKQLMFSEITYFEIMAGLEYKNAKKKIEKFELFVYKNTILKIDSSSIKISARIYGELRREGILIGTPDLLIAGSALDKSLEIVTNNEKHYKHIKGLKVVNWMK